MILRIIVSPFVFIMTAIYSFWKLGLVPFKVTYNFTFHGGEVITYKEDSKKTIADIYYLIKEKTQDGTI